MQKWNETNTIFIMASKGYTRTAIEDKCLKVFSPYYGDNGVLRMLREICFRLPFFPKSIWYNKCVLNERHEIINILDVNVTRHFLKWIVKYFPNSQINFIYENMVGMARNINPEQIPQGIRIWTYDDYDARKYNIRLYDNYWAKDMILKQRKESEYDVFFIGKDKGRGEKILEFEKKLHKMGLKTKFIITKDRKTSKKKSFYQKPISYEDVVDYDTRSRAILNITMENQEGVTMRDIESVTIGVKLITTNRNIVKKDLYNENNVFILGVNNLDTLPDFLERKNENVWEKIKEKHTFEAMLEEITGT